MEIISILADICTIIGMFITIFVASQVIKVSKYNHNNGEICQEKNKIKNTVKGKAAIANDHSTSTYIDYTGAQIIGEIDSLPELKEDRYPISVLEFDKYNMNIAKNTCEMVVPKNSDTICFIVDFGKVISEPEKSKWIGYSIQSLPMKDWRSFIEEDYMLQFSYIATGSIKEIWIELTNKYANKKIFKQRIELYSNNLKFLLPLNSFKMHIKDWKSVDEICFVFFPEECIGQQGSVFITDLSICRDK